MTTRTDVIFDVARSPRIAIVAKASNTMVMQDYVDTVRPFESSFIAMSFPFLMQASGKEDLGGGVSVAITAEEQDLKLSFESELVPAETGTVTTPSGAPDVNNEQTFVDSAAAFEANNVTRGSFLINFTDLSVADVVEVVNEMTLITTALTNGGNNQWDTADVYHCFNIIQKTTQGGNLVAVDAVDVAFPAILPTAFTQVIQQASSSATLQNLDSLEVQLNTIEAQTTAAAIGAAVWNAATATYNAAGSFGNMISRKLMQVIDFFGLRT